MTASILKDGPTEQIDEVVRPIEPEPTASTGTQTHRKPDVPKPNQIGLFALVLACLGFALTVATMMFLWMWVLPVPILIAAIVLGVIGLSRFRHSKTTSIAAIVIAVLALLPPTMGLMNASNVSGSGAGETTSLTDPSTGFDGVVRILTGSTSPGGGDTGGGGSGGGGSVGTTGTGTGSDTGGSGGDGTTTGGDGTPLVDVSVGAGSEPLVDVEVDGLLDGDGLSADVDILGLVSGSVNQNINAGNGLSLRVNSVECGQPLLSLGGLNLNLTGQRCEIAVAVTNGTDHTIAIDSSTLVGHSASGWITADATLGTALAANVQAGATTSGSLFIRLPLVSATLDTLEFRLGGQPSSSVLSINVN